ncbi:MAG TPA: hypothetical protein VMR97_08795 [Acidimicrobiales bacterium]|nr:hypothetical protein [Acidimicrobiales bacterium]
MAYVVRRPRGRFEIRESTTTPAGPRTRSLATFRALNEEVLEDASRRARAPLDRKRLRVLAERLGAPVEGSPADRAARSLLVELASGRRPRPGLSRLVVDALTTSGPGPEPSSRDSIIEWLGASARRRGETLRDLLDLTDHLPARSDVELRYPPFKTLERPAG